MGNHNTGTYGQTNTLGDDEIDQKPIAKFYRRQENRNNGIKNKGIRKKFDDRFLGDMFFGGIHYSPIDKIFGENVY